MFVNDWQEEGLAGGVVGRIITAVVTGGASEAVRVIAQNVAPEVKRQMDAFNVGVGHLAVPDLRAITKDIGQAIEHPLKVLWLPERLAVDALIKPEFKGLQEIGNAVNLGGFKPIKLVTNIAVQPIAQTYINLGDRPGRTLMNVGRGLPSIITAVGTGFGTGLVVGAATGGILQLVQVGKQTERSNPNLARQVYAGVGSGLVGGGVAAIAEGVGAASAALEAATSGTPQGILEIGKNVGEAFVEGAQSAAASAPIGQLFSGLSTAEKLGIAFLGQSALSMMAPRIPAPIDWSQAAVYDTSISAAQGQGQAVTPPPPPGVTRDYGSGAVVDNTVVIPPTAPAPGSSLPPLEPIGTASPLVPQQPIAVQEAVQAVQGGGIPATSPTSLAVPSSVGIGAGEKASNLVNLGPAPALLAPSPLTLGPLAALRPLGSAPALLALGPPPSPVVLIGVILALLLLTTPRRRAA